MDAAQLLTPWAFAALSAPILCACTWAWRAVAVRLLAGLLRRGGASQLGRHGQALSQTPTSQAAAQRSQVEQQETWSSQESHSSRGEEKPEEPECFGSAACKDPLCSTSSGSEHTHTHTPRHAQLFTVMFRNAECVLCFQMHTGHLRVPSTSYLPTLITIPRINCFWAQLLLVCSNS